MLILTSFNSNAQRPVENGYVIKQNKDNVWGFVRDRKEGPFGYKYEKNRFSNALFCCKRYHPRDIHGYGIGNMHYESIWFDLQTKGFKTQYISQPRRGKKIFMRVLVNGPLSLYEMEYSDQESNNILSIPFYKRRQEDYFVRVTQGVFGLRKKDVKNYFSDCPEIVEQIEASILNDPKAIAIFYNKICIDKLRR